MGVEHFYWFVDRAAVEPVLQLSWKEFLRKYPWRGKALSFPTVDGLIDFCVEPQPDSAEISRILSNCSLRWTLQHSNPAYYFLNEIVHHASYLKKHCPAVCVTNSRSWAEGAELLSAAVHAYLEGRIGEKTLWAVYNITGSYDPNGWLKLSKSEYSDVLYALGYGAKQRPIFRWQDRDCLADSEYRCLQVLDTRRFMAFLLRAWKENWPVPRLREDARLDLQLKSRDVPNFRDFDLSKQLVKCISGGKFVQPCALRYFG